MLHATTTPMANPSLPMRPYTSGLNRGGAAAPGLGGSTAGQNARMERERAERERIQREQVAAAALAPPRIEDLSEEQREEINEAVRTIQFRACI
jgi:hypothetical protein